MSPPKGAYNARRYHEDTVGRTREALAVTLKSLERTSIVFKNLSTLAEHVAPRCGQTAGNLRRNKNYRVMLEKYLARQRGAAAVISDRDRDVDVLKAKLRAAELEAANALRDKKRLESYISSHISARACPTSLPSAPPVETPSQNGDRFRRAFECTAQALVAVIERAETFEIDKKKVTIRDLSARPGNEEVVGPNHAQFFVEWLKTRPG